MSTNTPTLPANSFNPPSDLINFKLKPRPQPLVVSYGVGRGRPGSVTEYILQKKLPFTPLTVLGEKIVLNRNCAKFRNGGSHTFTPPYKDKSLRDQLKAAGHAVPEIVLEAAPDDHVYQDEFRDTSKCGDGGCGGGDNSGGDGPDGGGREITDIDAETDLHMAMVEVV